MAMPWKLAKAKAKAIRADTTGEKLAALNRLFNQCFRIQKEASFAAGKHIPMVVENVRGAIPWVGRSRWNFGPFHLWGDVPALMPFGSIKKLGGRDTHAWEKGQKHCGNWSTLAFREIHESSAGFNRKAASAMIAKIPLPLSHHIAATFRPHNAP